MIRYRKKERNKERKKETKKQRNKETRKKCVLAVDKPKLEIELIMLDLRED